MESVNFFKMLNIAGGTASLLLSVDMIKETQTLNQVRLEIINFLSSVCHSCNLSLKVNHQVSSFNFSTHLQMPRYLDLNEQAKS